MSIDNLLAARPDGLLVIFIRKWGNLLVDFLLTIYNESISLSYFPSEWGKCFISSVYKQGSTDNIANYWTLTKVNIFSKI